MGSRELQDGGDEFSLLESSKVGGRVESFHYKFTSIDGVPSNNSIKFAEKKIGDYINELSEEQVQKLQRIPEADRMQRQVDSLTIEGINRLLSRLSLMNIRKSLTASYILLAMTQQKKQENETQKKPKGWQKFKRSLDGNLHVIQEEE